MTHVVLVHGAWHGGWVWHKIERQLRAWGHRTWAPTLTRIHDPHAAADELRDYCVQHHLLPSPSDEPLRPSSRRFVLCGHSYGGMVITLLAADPRVARWLARLVYVDAFVPRRGECAFDALRPEGVARFRKSAVVDERWEGGGWTVRRFLPPPTPEAFGLCGENAALVRARCVPMPLSAYETRLVAPAAEALPATLEKVYVLAARYDPSPFQRLVAATTQHGGWRRGGNAVDASRLPARTTLVRVATAPHHVMLTHAHRLSSLLVATGRRARRRARRRDRVGRTRLQETRLSSMEK